MGLTMGVGTLALASLLPGIGATLVTRTREAVLTMDPRASAAQLEGATGGAILAVLVMVLPLAVLVMVAGIAGNLVSGGLVFSYRAINFDLNRINPLTGLKRMFDRQMLVRLGLAVAKLAILGLISWQVVGSRIPAIVATEGADVGTIAGTCLSAVFQLGLTITILLAVVALIDFVVQRRRAMESIRMTKDEVKQEYKEQEGDPLIRGARRRRARQMAFARMMDAVPTADVVVTNPTTLAVALKYDSLTMRAPRIVAKGQRLMAERIKHIAREHRVPVVEDKPLARALFSRPVGAEVPAHLYRAVAKLLVLVHQARFSGRGAGQGSGREAAARPRVSVAGSAARPWWAEAARSVGRPMEEAQAGEIARGLAAEAYGGTASSAGSTAGDSSAPDSTAESSPVSEADVFDGEDEGDDYETDFEAQEPVAPDEEELARAMADDELADLTAEEIAEFEEETDR